MRRLAFLLAATLTACSSPESDARFVDTALPDRASFPPVAQMLVHRCGTLDCHGTSARNLRLYGDEGLRLSSTDRPLAPPTTMAEIDQDYESVVSLEPEVMAAVVADRGAAPERLTLVRKSRGTEAHKGGALWSAGDDQDTCLVSWLAGAVDAGACTRALAIR